MNIRLALLMAILISGGLALAAYITVRQVPMWTEQDLARHEMLRLAIAASRNFLQFWFYLFPVIVLLCYGIVGLMAGTGGAKKDAKAH